jgi:hypothetical protein
MVTTGISLKGFAPILADYLNLTPLAVYERQRALVRCGLLPAPTTRGPGTGVRATPETVALLLTAILATDNLTEIDDRVIRLAKSRADDQRCPFTGAITFAKALAGLLANEGLATRTASIVVNRTTLRGRIHLQQKLNGVDLSSFGRKLSAPTKQNLEIEAKLAGGLISEIAGELPLLATVKSFGEES